MAPAFATAIPLLAHRLRSLRAPNAPPGPGPTWALPLQATRPTPAPAPASDVAGGAAGTAAIATAAATTPATATAAPVAARGGHTAEPAGADDGGPDGGAQEAHAAPPTGSPLHTDGRGEGHPVALCLPDEGARKRFGRLLAGCGYPLLQCTKERLVS